MPYQMKRQQQAFRKWEYQLLRSPQISVMGPQTRTAYTYLAMLMDPRMQSLKTRMADIQVSSIPQARVDDRRVWILIRQRLDYLRLLMLGCDTWTARYLQSDRRLCWERVRGVDMRLQSNLRSRGRDQLACLVDGHLQSYLLNRGTDLRTGIAFVNLWNDPCPQVEYLLTETTPTSIHPLTDL